MLDEKLIDGKMLDYKTPDENMLDGKILDEANYEVQYRCDACSE